MADLSPEAREAFLHLFTLACLQGVQYTHQESSMRKFLRDRLKDADPGSPMLMAYLDCCGLPEETILELEAQYIMLTSGGSDAA